MLKSMLKIGAATLLAIAIASVPASLQAQTNEKAATSAKHAAEKKVAGEKKPRAIPFHGSVAAIDNIAKTLMVGERTFQVTSETKIIKGNKPAVLADGPVGEKVTGSYKKTADGKLIAASIYFGGKSEGKAAEKKKEHKPETETIETK